MSEVQGIHHVTAITAHGQKTAEWLLRAIYNHSRGLDAGWGVYDVQTKERLNLMGGIQADGK